MNSESRYALVAVGITAAGLTVGLFSGWLLTAVRGPEPALGKRAETVSRTLVNSREVRPVVSYYAPAQGETTETMALPEPDPVPSLSATTETIVVEEAEALASGILDVPALNIPSVPSGPGGGIAAVPPALDSERVILTGQAPETPPLDPLEWDPLEFQTLAAPPGEGDALSAVPDGTVIAPAQPLTAEEVLVADQSVDPIGYTTPGIGIGTPVPVSETGAIPPAGYLPEGEIQLESAEFLDYDDERNTIYGHGRIVARFGQYKLEADRMQIDTRLRELQAQGNVKLTGPNEYVEAEALNYDAKNNMGTAYKARGRSGIIYFLADPFEDGGRTTFRQLSRAESHLEHGSFTTCDFPVPHYRISAKEFTIMAGDRIYARNVVLYILEKPVLWLPYYTRSFQDESPWALKVGSDRQLGFFARVAYSWRTSQYTPSDVDDRLMVKRSSTQGRLMYDWFSKLGFGKGLQYRYNVCDGKHQGRIFLYELNDRLRDVEEDNPNRSVADIFHRSHLGEAADGADLSALVDVNYVSDPDIYFDLFDRLRGSGEFARGRIVERHAVFGLERTHDEYFAGVRVELRDRIGRDRFSQFSDPRDNDFDFDRRFNDEEFFTLLGPGVGPTGFFYPSAGEFSDPTSLPNQLDRGLASSRFGRVSSRLPQLTVSTNRDRLWCLPLWYHLDLNVFNNLDKGLNTVGTEDDSFVTGFDFYQSLTHLKRFSERYTVRTKLGLGFGVAQRLDDSFNPDIPDGALFPFVQGGQVISGQVVGVTYTDPDTFLVGEREMSLKDVDPAFAYTDIDSKFNARITDSVTAFVRYRARANLGDNLGYFYERVGSRTSQDDLYAFRTPEQWIEGGLSYALAHPRLSVSLAAGRNLQPESEWTAHELLQYANLGVGWANLRNTLLLNSGVSLQERQQRDPTDPNSYLANTLTYYLSGSYLPVHQRYYARVGAFFVQNPSADPLGRTDNDRDFDTDDETVMNVAVGRRIGQKYLVEYRTRIRSRQSGNEDTFLRIERDFHDAVAGISFGFRGYTLSREEERTENNNFQLRFHFRLKPAAEKGVTPVRNSGNLFSSRKASAFDTRNAIF